MDTQRLRATQRLALKLGMAFAGDPHGFCCSQALAIEQYDVGAT